MGRKQKKNPETEQVTPQQDTNMQGQNVHEEQEENDAQAEESDQTEADATEEDTEGNEYYDVPQEDGTNEDEAIADDDGESVSEEALAHIPNQKIRKLMDRNFIEYASYVIKDRAIPDIDDGLKPVQRRVLWTLFTMDNGNFHKVANVVGETMKYHPHGDSSIYGALVTLANKELFIDKQGSFGSIILGTPAAAGRYIECRLSKLAREVLFNPDLTELADTYDGRNQEPVILPSKIPNLLLMGAEGVAVGTKTYVFPYNFNEVLRAQISILKGEEFKIYPDFPQGGLMDVSDYQDGLGKIIMRSHIEIDGHNLVIRDIPAATDTGRLMDSIEAAVNKNKIKVSTFHDYTTDQVEIQLVLQRGYAPERALDALYTYTNCQMAMTSYPMVICDNVPYRMSITEILMRNTAKLVQYLTWELQITSAKCLDKILGRTLAQIFIEERIYKRIETCRTKDAMFAVVRDGLEQFKDEWLPLVQALHAAIEASPHVMPMNKDEVFRLEQLKNGVIPDVEVDCLVEIPIRRIAAFEIDKNRKEIDVLQKTLDDATKKLKNVQKYAIKYLEKLIEEYGDMFPRHTEICLEKFEKIDRQRVALANIRVGWDRKNCYIGTKVKSDDFVMCSDFDHLLCIERTGEYKVVSIPEKIFIDRLYEFRKYDKNTVFGIIYTDKKTGRAYYKRTAIKSFITDKDYRLIPEGSKLEMITPRPNSVYEIKVDTPIRDKQIQTIFMTDAPLRSPKAGGLLLSPRKLLKVTFVRLLDESEIAAGEEPELIEMPEESNIPEAEAEETDVKPAETEKTEPVMNESVSEENTAAEQTEKVSEENAAAEPARPKRKSVVKEEKPEEEEKTELKTESEAKDEEKKDDGDDLKREEDSWNIQPDLGL